METADARALEARFEPDISAIPAADWNRLAGTDYPFLRHEFLRLLERSGCVGGNTGWQPCHLTLYRGEQLLAVAPLYLKSHSYGEYVFDWSWADAWRRNGMAYYPKLLTAVPFTPATGPRLCLSPQAETDETYAAIMAALKQYAAAQGASSWHLLFPEEDIANRFAALGTSRRVASQFHWFNRDYRDFEDFLSTLNSRKRKSLRRERRRVREQEIELRLFEGSEIGPEQWEKFYFFYQMTYAKRSGHGGYLSKAFFLGLGEAIGEHCVMTLAYRGEHALAGALYFRSSDTLYGRYWGCEQELDCLHFEACYYQGIDYCIDRGLKRFDPGAQGEHKIQRGFEPVPTWSNHWIADEDFARAIEDFTRRESGHIDQYMEQAATYLPFKSG